MGNNRVDALFAAKWSAQIGKRGFAAVPHCIITCSAELGLSQVDKSVLEVIIGKCWEAGDVAWPSVEYIARCIGRKSSTVTASTTKLEKDGWINKKQRFNDTNLYSLEPAINKLDKHLDICPIFNKNVQSHQNTGGLDSQKTGDYIETLLTRTNNISRDLIKNEIHDPYKFFNDKNIANRCRDSEGGMHDWREYLIEKELHSGENVVYFYFVCINEGCGMRFHKKEDRPWAARYPALEHAE